MELTVIAVYAFVALFGVAVLVFWVLDLEARIKGLEIPPTDKQKGEGR